MECPKQRDRSSHSLSKRVRAQAHSGYYNKVRHTNLKTTSLKLSSINSQDQRRSGYSTKWIIPRKQSLSDKASIKKVSQHHYQLIYVRSRLWQKLLFKSLKPAKSKRLPLLLMTSSTSWFKKRSRNWENTKRLSTKDVIKNDLNHRWWFIKGKWAIWGDRREIRCDLISNHKHRF